MHLLHVFATFGRGGPQVRFGQVAARCPQGWRHTVVAMDGCTDARETVPDSVKLEVVAAPPKGGFLGTARLFRAMLREQDPSLLCTYNWGAIEAVAGAWAVRVPLVHHEDGFGPEELHQRLGRRNKMRRILLKRARAVVVPSTVLGGIASAEWKVGPRRLRVLPNGVDLARFRPPSGAVSGASDRPFVFGTVGGLRAEKDHANLVAALVHAPAVAARIIGDGPERQRLAQLADDLGVADRLQLLGPMADPSAEMARWDGFVLPSLTEQMPLSLLEAMATGLPVVATDVGDVGQIVAAPGRDLVVPAQDAAALGGAMQRLSADRKRAAVLGAANRARCERDFELDACMDAFVAVYEAARAPA